ncbi:MAG TPA: ABC transporter substrate-binding protein [Firmicutes bacterium]|nr:ABC transporter substrate-binding protein [Bacillota bacterium]
MMNMIKKIKPLMAVLLCLGIIAGCSDASTNTDVEQETQTNTDQTTVIRLGVMSASDSAPILLAQEKGYFEANNVELELEIFSNGATKQSSIQAGELDAAMVSMIQFVNNVNAGLKAKITTTTDGTFPVVLSKNYTEKTDVKVGLMEVSVTNFLADQYLADYNVEKIFINEMPVRMQMLMADELDMAVLPEPLASNAELNGLTKKVYGNPDDFTPNAIIFTDEFIENNPNTVANFHKAYNQAVADINENEDLAKDILIEKLELNPEIKDLIVLPTYHQTRIPTEAYLNEVKVWTEELQGSTLNVPYAEVVTTEFVAE